MLGDSGVPLAMPSVAASSGDAVRDAAAITVEYGAMYQMLQDSTSHPILTPTSLLWASPSGSLSGWMGGHLQPGGQLDHVEETWHHGVCGQPGCVLV